MQVIVYILLVLFLLFKYGTRIADIQKNIIYFVPYIVLYKNRKNKISVS